MRLICPKCNAQYDIASDAIPSGGRDVQCSSCSHTWFQTELTPDAASSVVTPPAPSRVAAEVENAVTKRKPLDSSIADILRQEAAREKAEAEASIAPESAPEPAAQPRRPDPIAAEETRRRISMMAEEQDSDTAAAVAAAATGAVAEDTNLRSVPSIDEINQQLRARSQSGDGANLTEAEQQEVVERRGFRRGFAFMLILIAIAIAPYIFAEQIVAQFPQYAEQMDAYLAFMDTLRLWLNEQFQTVRGMIAEYAGSAEPTAPAEPAPAVESSAPAAPAAPSE